MFFSHKKTISVIASSVLLLGMLSACSPAAAPFASSPGSDEGAESPVTKVALGIGGQTALLYLPTTLAEQLGYYEEEGLEVDLQDLQGGSKALTALIGGSIDVASGFYEHTIQMQIKKQSIKSFVQIGRSPGLVFLVAPDKTDEIKSLKDLKGTSVGVTAPGSSTDMLVRYLLAKEGMDVDDVSVVGMGAGASAIAAMESGEIVAGVMLEPDITELEKRSGAPAVTLADMRTPEGVRAIYGIDTWSSSCFYAKSEWLEQNPETAKKLARAMTRTLQFIAEHDGAEIAALMPKEFAGDDLEGYGRLIDELKGQLTTDGRNSQEGANAALESQRVGNPDIGDKDVELSRTYTNEFIE